MSFWVVISSCGGAPRGGKFRNKRCTYALPSSLSATFLRQSYSFCPSVPPPFCPPRPSIPPSLRHSAPPSLRHSAPPAHHHSAFPPQPFRGALTMHSGPLAGGFDNGLFDPLPKLQVSLLQSLLRGPLFDKILEDPFLVGSKTGFLNPFQNCTFLYYNLYYEVHFLSKSWTTPFW